MDELRTDYKDQLLDTSVNTERKFNLVDQDGNVIASEVSLRDITQYSQTGDTFGAADINKITAKINEQNNSLNSFQNGVNTIVTAVNSVAGTSHSATSDPADIADTISSLNSSFGSSNGSYSSYLAHGGNSDAQIYISVPANATIIGVALTRAYCNGHSSDESFAEIRSYSKNGSTVSVTIRCYSAKPNTLSGNVIVYYAY